MDRLFDSVAAGALTPLLFWHGALAQALEHQGEQARAWGSLVDTVLGARLFAERTVNPAPRDQELFLGKSVSHTKTFADAQTACFGWLSLDFNPLHFNERLAARTRFQGRIAHGFHTASLFSGVLAELTPWCVYLHQDLDFTGPVRPGDVITAVGRIEEIDPKGVVSVALECRNQRQEVVVRGRAFVKKLREVYRPGGAPQ